MQKENVLPDLHTQFNVTSVVMDGLKLRQAGASDSQFSYGVKKAAFKEYVEKVRGWN